MKKKEIRGLFRISCLERDDYKCKVCSKEGNEDTLDVHHIINRKEIINGGYVKENGICLCEDCHLLAETFSEHGDKKYSPKKLFELIDSNIEMAHKYSAKI